MGYVGVKPSAVPLTSADITDGIIVNADINSSAAIALTKLASTGTLTVDNIQFPATAVASADANNLDDYEEGTFTPSITSGGGTITTTGSAFGIYTKIGRQVTVSVTGSIVTNGTASQNIAFTLPFTAIGSPSTNFQSSARENQSVGTQIQASIVNGAAVITFRKNDNTYPGGTGTQLQTTATYFI